jgi:MFS transporter, UMF1 family
MAQSLNRKIVASWCLYDFANSFYVVLPAVIWQTYYQGVIVGNEHGLGDLWWGRIISTSMLSVAISSPFMGAVADHAGIRKRLLILYTLVSVGAVCLFTTVEPGMVVWGFVVSVISYVGFEGALVFYNAYLPEIAPRQFQGRLSGWGFAVGYAGSLLALVLALPFIQWKFLNGAFIAIAAAYLIFSLPAFLWLPSDLAPKLVLMKAAMAGARETWQTFRDILKLRETRRFLLAYLFFEDGVNTVIFFAAGFAVQTLRFTTTEALGLFTLVQASALAGALLWAKPTDTLGPKRVVMSMLVQWSIAVMAAYMAHSKTAFFLIAILAGSGLGAIQAASRAFMSTLIPKGREGDFFGFYSLCGKSAAVMGPLLFGHVSEATGGNQRAAILSVMVFFVIGGVLLSRVKAGGPTAELTIDD